jgi:hypothetical protein
MATGRDFFTLLLLEKIEQQQRKIITSSRFYLVTKFGVTHVILTKPMLL